MTDPSRTRFPVVVEPGLAEARVAELSAALPALIDRPGRSALEQSSKSIHWMLKNRQQRVAAAVLDAFCESPLFDRALEFFPDGFSFLIANCAVRRHQPGVASSRLGYHFDASFIGRAEKMLNFWVPLTPLGDGVPGLTFVDPEFVEQKVWPLWQRWLGESDAASKGLTLIEDRVLQQLSDGGIAALELAPQVTVGGALLFDERTLHRTQIVSGQERARLSIEYRLAGRGAVPRAYIEHRYPIVDATRAGSRSGYPLKMPGEDQ